MKAIKFVVYKVELLRQSWIFSKAAPPGLEPTTFTSTIFYSTTALHLPYVKRIMYFAYILFMNHMHAGEWERAPGRTFTADILPILNCAHIN